MRKLRDCGPRWGRRQRSSQTFSWQETDLWLGPACGDRGGDPQGTLSYRTCPPLNTWLRDSRGERAGGAGLGSGEGSRNVSEFQGCGAWVRKAEKGSGRKPEPSGLLAPGDGEGDRRPCSWGTAGSPTAGPAGPRRAGESREGGEALRFHSSHFSHPPGCAGRSFQALAKDWNPTLRPAPKGNLKPGCSEWGPRLPAPTGLLFTPQHGLPAHLCPPRSLYHTVPPT